MQMQHNTLIQHNITNSVENATEMISEGVYFSIFLWKYVPDPFNMRCVHRPPPPKKKNHQHSALDHLESNFIYRILGWLITSMSENWYVTGEAWEQGGGGGAEPGWSQRKQPG